MPTQPTTMNAIVIDDYQAALREAIRSLYVGERPVPKLKAHQVLVKIHAAPCNPSDLMFIAGRYGVSKPLPAVPGWEGAGTVVAAGSLLGQWLVGRRVAVGGQDRNRDGTWADYVVASAFGCIPLRDGVDWDQGATLVINPLTAAGLLSTAKQQGHRAVVQNAAAGQVGRMVIKLAQKAGTPLVNIVRRQEQVELLQQLGAEHILNSSDPDYGDQLRDRCERLKVTAAFDAVAGPATGELFNAMARGGTVYVYGALSNKKSSDLNTGDIIFRGKRVEGFYLGAWTSGTNLLRALRAANEIQQMMAAGEFQTTVQRRASFAEAPEALLQYVDNMTEGKILFQPEVP
ncbi:MAG: zinc-binding dehydrogenase [Caldilineaceae bacterium]|nr:zinc-binding dehydrogenase [Caldilineaceae bacterium]